MAGSELPMVLINVMRGGPGLGSIGPSQSDYFQATKGHGHGDYRVPVLAPVVDRRGGRPRRRRVRARRALPDAGDDPRRRRPGPGDGAGRARPTGRRHVAVDGWELTGADGRPPRVVRSLHLRPEDLEAHNRHLQAKYATIAEREVRWAGEDARRRRDRHRRLRHGRASRADGDRAGARRRPARRALPADHALAVPVARRWPRPPPESRAIVVVEMSAGQLVEDVRLAVEGRRAGLLPRPHGRHGPDARRGASMRLRRAWATTDQRGGPAADEPDPEPIELGSASTMPAARPARRVIYDATRRLADRRASTPLLPGLRPRDHPPPRRRAARRDATSGRGRSGSPRSAAACSPTTTSRSTSSSRPTGAPRRSRPASGALGPTPSCSPTRATATWPRSGPPRSSTPRRAASGSASIFVNNGIYGMTGGQMAPTTLLGQRTTSTPDRPRSRDRRLPAPDHRDAGPAAGRHVRRPRLDRGPERRSARPRRCSGARSRPSWPAAASRSSRSCRPARSAGA